MVVHVVEEVAVLAQPAAVADAVRAADVDRLIDRLGTVRLAGVDGDVDVVVADELERRLVVLRRVVVLGAGEIEPDDAAVLVRDRELRHLERRLGRDVADAADDDVRLDAERLLRLVQAFEHRLDDLRQAQAPPRVEHRRVADLHVAHVLARGVLGELVRDARERLLGLHDLERDVEGLEVLDERAGVLAEVHRAGEPVGGVGGELDAVLLGELEDRRESKRAVEMDVEIRLRKLLEERERKRHRRSVMARWWPGKPAAGMLCAMLRSTSYRVLFALLSMALSIGTLASCNGRSRPGRPPEDAGTTPPRDAAPGTDSGVTPPRDAGRDTGVRDSGPGFDSGPRDSGTTFPMDGGLPGFDGGFSLEGGLGFPEGGICTTDADCPPGQTCFAFGGFGFCI